MPLSADTLSKLPKAAQQIIGTSLENIQPTMEMGPRRAQLTRDRVETVITEISKHGTPGAGGVITHNAIAARLWEEVEWEDDEIVRDVLRGIAGRITSLTSKKRGSSRCRPRPMAQNYEDEM